MPFSFGFGKKASSSSAQSPLLAAEQPVAATAPAASSDDSMSNGQAGPLQETTTSSLEAVANADRRSSLGEGSVSATVASHGHLSTGLPPAAASDVAPPVHAPAGKQQSRSGTQTHNVLPKLMQLFESPHWISSIDNFLDNECLVFEADVAEHETYRQVFHNYKSMIDKLLMEQRMTWKVSPEVLWDAVHLALTQTHSSYIAQELLQPLVFYENYQIFKQAMVSQNMAMQLYALESIQRKTGSCPLQMESGERSVTEQLASADRVAYTALPDGPTATSGGPLGELYALLRQLQQQDEDDALLQDVLRRSKDEYDELQRRIREEEEAVERALRESERLAALLTDSQARVSVQDLRALLEQVEALEVVHEESEAEVAAESGPADQESRPVETRPAVRSPPPSTPRIAVAALADQDADSFVSAKHFVSADELQRRQAFLRAQRDRLQTKKDQLRQAGELQAEAERKKQLLASQDDNGKSARKVLADRLRAEVAGHPST